MFAISSFLNICILQIFLFFSKIKFQFLILYINLLLLNFSYEKTYYKLIKNIK